MSHDHDDGLVHGHGAWSSEPPRHARPRPVVIPAPGHDHDEGIEHGHGWACGERGRPSHQR